jgi:hypothetical protein
MPPDASTPDPTSDPAQTLEGRLGEPVGVAAQSERSLNAKHQAAYRAKRQLEVEALKGQVAHLESVTEMLRGSLEQASERVAGLEVMVRNDTVYMLWVEVRSGQRGWGKRRLVGLFKTLEQARGRAEHTRLAERIRPQDGPLQEHEVVSFTWRSTSGSPITTRAIDHNQDRWTIEQHHVTG